MRLLSATCTRGERRILRVGATGNRTHGAALTHSSNHERHCAGADRRRHQLLQETLAEGGSREERELHLRFLLSPVRIVEHLGAVNSGRVGGIVLGSNRLEGPKGSRKAVATGHEETVSCGLSSGRLDTGACRSWGFHSTRQATRCHTAPGEYCLRVEEVRASRIVRRFLCAAPMARIPLELLIAVAQRY